MGTGFIIDGKREAVPGLDVTNWFDDPRLRLDRSDFRERRTPWVRQIVLHTTRGIPGGSDMREQDIRPGLGQSMEAGLRCARWWSKNPEPAGAHLVIDHDGTVHCCVDLQREAAHHAGHANQTSIGIELYQGNGAELYEGQLEACVLVCDFLTRRFGIQRQTTDQYMGGPIPRFRDDVDDVVGIIGHRDLTPRRGRGDPGSPVFYRLRAAGYESWKYELGEDREVWRRRQRQFAIDPADGVAGPITVQTLRAAGYAHGLWVRRPGDEASGTSPGTV